MVKKKLYRLTIEACEDMGLGLLLLGAGAIAFQENLLPGSLRLAVCFMVLGLVMRVIGFIMSLLEA